MDNQDLDINKEKEDIETLEDEEPENLNEEPNEVENTDNSNNVEQPAEPESDLEQEYSNQNRFRRNQQYHDRQYYKDQIAESEKKIDEAKIKRDEAQKEKGRDWKKNDPNDKGPVKSDGSNTHIKNSKDKREDRKNLRQANKEVRQAKRDSRRAKLDRLRNAADAVAHPVDHAENYVKNKLKNRLLSPFTKARDALKSGAKKVGQTIAASIKSGGLLKSKVIIIGAGALLAILAIVLIFFVVAGADDEKGSGGSYKYKVNGQEISNVNVKIMNSSNTEISSVPIEKYAMGVAINALGPDAITNNRESLKAAIVIARSAVLNSEDVTSGSVQFKNDEMVYWEYTQDLYKLVTDDGTNYSPEVTAETPNAELVYNALTEDQIAAFIKLADEVGGVYITGDSLSGIVLDHTTVESIKSKEASGIDDYNDILAAQYPDATVGTGEFVGYTFSGEAGEYSTWKQGDERWGSISLGTNSGTTMAEIGCYVTSNAIAIAYLNATTTLPEFNPGTFATELKRLKTFGSGGGLDNYANVSKVVPGLTKERIYTSNLSNSERIKRVKEDAEQGYAIIMQVKCNGYNMPGCTSGTHFVVLDPITSSANKWEDLAIWNPSGKKTWAQYNRALAYYDRLIVAK